MLIKVWDLRKCFHEFPRISQSLCYTFAKTPTDAYCKFSSISLHSLQRPKEDSKYNRGQPIDIPGGGRLGDGRLRWFFKLKPVRLRRCAATVFLDGPSKPDRLKDRSHSRAGGSLETFNHGLICFNRRPGFGVTRSSMRMCWACGKFSRRHTHLR